MDGSLKTDRTIYIQRVLLFVGIVAAVVILLLLFWYALDIFLLIFAGILLAVLLRSITNWVSERTPLPDKAALGVVILVLLVLIGAATWYLAPQVGAQADQLSQTLPQTFENFEDRLRQYSWGQWLVQEIPTSPDQFSSISGSIFSRATGIVSTALDFFTFAFVIVVIGFYLAVDPNLYKNGLIHLIPQDKRSRARQVLAEVGHTLQWWILGQLISMIVVAILAGIGLWLIGIPLALTLGLVAGLLEFIPYIGPILGFAPIILIALSMGATPLLWVIALYLVIQFIESYIVTPLVQQRAVMLPPAVTIAAQVLLGILAGPLGVLLATPLAAVVMVLVKMLYVKDVLHDTTQTLPSQSNKDGKQEKNRTKIKESA